MTQFAPRHLCEKLQAAGLVSESRFYYGRLKDEPDLDLASLSAEEIKNIDCLFYDVGYDGGLIVKRVGPYLLSDGMNVFNQKRDMIFCTPAFTLLDLIGPSEQARANAVKWWGGKNINGGPADLEFWEESRLHLVNVSYITSDSEAWEYVERTGKAA